MPDGIDQTRSYAVSARLLKWAGGTLLTLLLFGLVGVGLFVAELGGGASVVLSRRERALGDRLLAMQTRLDSLSDTIAAIGRRDEQIRLLAGLAPVDSQSMPGKLVESPVIVADGRTPNESMLSRMASATNSDIKGLIERANALSASFAQVSDTLERHYERLTRIPSIMPTAGWLSSAFTRSRFHPILHRSRPHEGIDVSAPMGAPIVAPGNGVVSRVAREAGYGLVVEVNHGDGIVTKYAHCSRIHVKQGQRVKRGDLIAAVGNSGLSTGPHLHYEIHVNGKVVDPLTYVLPGEAIPE
ncbi:MAG TPA: M23 family metallopeptidase [Gemmatimonadaceae bacterium]|nr:M23 family metallopeptidase [Gemmatimonadaceae bacterium]